MDVNDASNTSVREGGSLELTHDMSADANLRALEALSLRPHSNTTPNAAGEKAGFFKISEEIRDMIYHELWLQTPIISTLQYLPRTTTDSVNDPRVKPGFDDLFAFGVAYASSTTDQLRQNEFDYNDEKFFKPGRDSGPVKLPIWLLTCKAFLHEGVKQLHHNGEWAYYEPFSLADKRDLKLYTLLDPLMTRTVSANTLELMMVERYGDHWILSTVNSYTMLKDTLGRLAHGNISELKLGLDVGYLSNSELRVDLPSPGPMEDRATEWKRQKRISYDQLASQSLDLSILDPVFFMEGLRKITFTIRRTIPAPTRSPEFTSERRQAFAQQVLDDMLGERHMVQAGLRDLGQELWGDGFRERLHPAQVLDNWDIVMPVMLERGLWPEFKFSEVQELYCVRTQV